MSDYRIAVIPGDGIGPEIMDEALRTLEKAGSVFGHSFSFTKLLMGGAAYDAVGTCFPEQTVPVCRSHDAVLLGAVGGPKWDALPGPERPEKALLKIREGLGLYANLRPAIMHKALAGACPIKPENVGDSMDLLIVRELTGGIYFGEHGWRDGKFGPEAYDVERYSETEIRRIAHVAFKAAMARKKSLVSVDKANVLETSRLWRRVVSEVSAEYPEVSLSHMYVDNAAMQLVYRPGQFDVILTSNMFGDILSDEASMITGSLGMLPSASLSDGSFGLYEPSHGSAPDIAGKGIANPIATILSASMMLRYSLSLAKEADAIDYAVESVLNSGMRTADIAEPGTSAISTAAMGEAIRARL
ncbi:MAG: 3-isopropylmalate dehydrogenase [Mailhella sp.]|nr:3-isopropylmalate dehydrogenase [Mailhella sp.]